MKACARCGQELDSQLEVFRGTACPSCRADLRSCVNCTFYHKGAHWDCRETISEPVGDKERANFCDFFRFKVSAPPRGGGKPGGGGPSRSAAKNDFNKLFGD